MAATRLTLDILLPNLWSVNELRVALDLLAGPGSPHQTASPFFGASEGGGRERVTVVSLVHLIKVTGTSTK